MVYQRFARLSSNVYNFCYLQFKVIGLFIDEPGPLYIRSEKSKTH